MHVHERKRRRAGVHNKGDTANVRLSECEWRQRETVNTETQQHKRQHPKQRVRVCVGEWEGRCGSVESRWQMPHQKQGARQRHTYRCGHSREGVQRVGGKAPMQPTGWSAPHLQTYERGCVSPRNRAEALNKQRAAKQHTSGAVGPMRGLPASGQTGL